MQPDFFFTWLKIITEFNAHSSSRLGWLIVKEDNYLGEVLSKEFKCMMSGMEKTHSQ